MNYKLAYRVGFHPWEDAEHQPGFVQRLSALLDQEESGREPPYGPALDVGTGSGIWGIHLAQRGWQVTGLDIVERALDRAPERVSNAGVDMRVVRGDVTDLRSGDIGTSFKLVLDTGTFHGLTSAQCKAMGQSVAEVTQAGATMLMMVWQPRRRGPAPRGTSTAEIGAAFPGWEVIDEGPSGFAAPKPLELALRPEERWYRLTRE